MRQVFLFGIAELWRLRPWDFPGFWRMLLGGLSISLATQTALAQHEHSSSTFEVFVAAEGLFGSGQPHPHDDDSRANADIVAGLTHEQFRAFGEYFLTPNEHDLERFQLGYELEPETMLWVGRFQQPASAWNTEHHHGRYLQTPITRPSIEYWEDEEGLIPQHITGALIESRRQLGSDAGMQLSAGVGAAPRLGYDSYKPITLVGNNPGRHGLSLTGRVAFLPQYDGTSSFGLLAGHDEMFARSRRAVAILRSYHAALGVYGAYADWTVGAWHFIGVGYYVDIRLDRPGRDESFISAYAEAERQLPHQLTAYGRVEDSARMRESRYVTLFDDHSGDIDITVKRLAAGLRWDYMRRQALSLELTHVESLEARAYQVRLQWSAAIP
jgi:hypothetical protein